VISDRHKVWCNLALSLVTAIPVVLDMAQNHGCYPPPVHAVAAAAPSQSHNDLEDPPGPQFLPALVTIGATGRSAARGWLPQTSRRRRPPILPARRARVSMPPLAQAPPPPPNASRRPPMVVRPARLRQVGPPLMA
jgi:hypothetical protein